MERLTDDKIYTFDNHLDKCESNWIVKVQKRLKEYEDAEEQGLLLRLPCKVGDTLYCLGCEGIIYEGICNGFELGEEERVFIVGKTFAWWRNFSRFGNLVFLTKEEAEQKLAEMKVG